MAQLTEEQHGEIENDVNKIMDHVAEAVIGMNSKEDTQLILNDFTAAKEILDEITDKLEDINNA